MRRLVDHEHLWAYARDLHQQPGVAETCNPLHVKRHYYQSHSFVNPTRIVPVGPTMAWDLARVPRRMSGRTRDRFD